MSIVSRPAFARGATLYLRVALGTAFLSAVADRFGLWGPPGAAGVAWGNFANFLDYTGSLVPFLHRDAVVAVGWAVTIAEVGLGIALLLGWKIRASAGASGVLLLSFAAAMMLGDGVKAPFDASVLSASAGALLLSAYPDSMWSLDAALETGKG